MSMIHNFSETEKQYNKTEDKLLKLKSEYQKPHMSEEQVKLLRQKIKEADRMYQKERKKSNIVKWTAAAAVFIGAFIILPNTSYTIAHAMEQIPILGQLVEVVTFRNYEYETDRNMADITVPEIKLDEAAQDSDVQEKLEQTADEINAEIQEITDRLVEEFEANIDEEGYQDVTVKSEVLATTADYFTLKLICFQAAGSGYQWNYYYTIDLKTGERLRMKDLFIEGADYITATSENIKEQMQAQMDADENVYYWLHDEIEEWNFKAITDETSFYLNEKGNMVIGFNEGDVAPMYMGAVEFEIPAEVLADIRK